MCQRVPHRISECVVCMVFCLVYLCWYSIPWSDLESRDNDSLSILHNFHYYLHFIVLAMNFKLYNSNNTIIDDAFIWIDWAIHHAFAYITVEYINSIAIVLFWLFINKLFIRIKSPYWRMRVKSKIWFIHHEIFVFMCNSSNTSGFIKFKLWAKHTMKNCKIYSPSMSSVF